MIRDLPGSGNWLPGQVQSVPPGVTVGIVVDISMQYGNLTGESYSSILAGIKAAVVSVVNGAAGPMLAAGAVQAAAAGAPGVASVGAVTFDGDASLAEVPAPTSTRPEYVTITPRTIR